MTNDAKKVLFLQGAGEGTHCDRDSKLVESLIRSLGADYDVAYPRMPEEADPRFDRWSAAITREIDSVGPSILVGHSYGGTVLIHTLAAHGRLLNNITTICLLAAPFMGQGGWSSDEITLVDGWANPLANFPLHLFHGGADTIVPKAHVDLYAAALPHAQVHRLAGQDHQLNNDLTEVAKALRQ